MTVTRALSVSLLALAGAMVHAAGQEPRPANVPFYTWVREDTFAGFLENDLTRFARGEQKTLEYLAETPGRPDAMNWLGATKVYRAVRAFKDGDAAAGEALLRDGLKAMDEAAAKSPNDVGVHATAGGTLALLASQLPDAHYRPLMERARGHYAVLYRVQGQMLAQLPLHLKGEVLAGLAETEFRVGDRQRATQWLNQIVAEMPDTAYARTAAAWLSAPDGVTKDSKLVCQSCHQPGRLSSWMMRQQKG